MTAFTIKETFGASKIEYQPVNGAVLVFIDGEPKPLITADSLPYARRAAFDRIRREARQ